MSEKSKSRGKQRSSVENIIDFLNQPIDLKPLVGFLESSKKETRGRPGANLDKQTERILGMARTIADKEGIAIEEALKRYGIDLESDIRADSESASEEMREDMLKSLDWELSEGGEAGGGLVRADDKNTTVALEKLRNLFSDLDEDVFNAVIGSINPKDKLFKERLILAGVCSREDLQNFNEGDPQGFLGSICIKNNADLNLLAEVLRSMPYYPLQNEDKGLFYEWLLDKGYLPYRVFKDAKKESKLAGVSIGRLVSKEEYIDAPTYKDALISYTGLPPWAKAMPRVSKKLTEAIPANFMDLFDIVPLHVTGKTLDAGVFWPFTPFWIANLEKATGKSINFHFVEVGKLKELRSGLMGKMKESGMMVADDSETASRVQGIVASASAVNMVRQIFEGALDARATDIHLDPQSDGVKLRFRIDGILYDVLNLDLQLYVEIASRIKILADLNITERRRPQDGHININIKGQQFDMRIASVPTRYGEKMAIRLVYAGRVMKRMNELGLEGKDFDKVQHFIAKPHGMILATGPVGSGKTTTLYSCLNEIDRSLYNVMSIEDPVEFELSLANQVQVNYDLDFGFVEGLRALLRQDPDSILLGEIRDEETARIAIRASMTGLLVFSTLHTNDAAGAITALYNFHLPTHLIANSLVGVVAQRLLRKVCPHCKTSYKPTKRELTELGIKPAQQAKIKKLYKGKGCPKCFGSGYLDRMGVFEVMEITPALRDAILEEHSEKELRNQAIKDGMRTLSVDGLDKVIKGETSAEEFLRILRF